MSLMSSSLLLQRCPACLVCLSWIVFVMGGRWPHSYCFVGFCLQDFFNIAHRILVFLPSSFFSVRLVSVRVVHPYSNIDRCLENTAFHFIGQFWLPYDWLSIVSCPCLCKSRVDVCLGWWDPESCINLSSTFRELPFTVEMSPLWLKYMYSVLSALT